MFMMPALEEIREKAAPVFKKYGVRRARVFGSFARGEARPGSDIDLLIEYERSPGFKYFSMREELKRRLGREVDLVTNESMNEFLRPYIMPDIRPLYGEER